MSELPEWWTPELESDLDAMLDARERGEDVSAALMEFTFAAFQRCVNSKLGDSAKDPSNH